MLDLAQLESNMKYKAFTQEPKPYLKRVFILKYCGGFQGYSRIVIEHELPLNAVELDFEAEDGRDYIFESSWKDGNYFRPYINHIDKHGKLNHTEELKPIKA